MSATQPYMGQSLHKLSCVDPLSRCQHSTSLSHIYFVRHDGTDSPADADDVVVVLNSFHSKIIKVRVSVFLGPQSTYVE